MRTSRFSKKSHELLTEVETLQSRLAETEEIIRAIRCGEVDAFFVPDETGGSVLALEGAESAYRVLVEAMSEGAAILIDNGMLLYSNSSLAAMLKAPLETVMGASLYRYLTPAYRETFRKSLEQAQIRTCAGETVFICADGASLPVWISLSPMHIHGVPGICITVTDLTERKQAEADLLASEQLYHDMFEVNSATKLLIDPTSGAIVKANQAAAAFYGWPTSVLETMNISQINTLSPVQIQAEMSLAAGNEHTYYDLQHRLASGEIRDVEIHASLIGSGKHKLLYSIIYDISDRKKAEETLRVNEERYRMLVEQAAEAILVYDVDQAKIVDANKIAEKLFSQNHEILCSQDVSHFYAQTQPDGRPVSESMADHIARALAGEVVVFDRVLVTANKVTIPCEERLVRLPSLDHHLLRASYVDISERKRTEEELRSFSLEDDLTGLCNRRGFFALGQQHIKIARRQEEQLYTIFIDLDGMKQINDDLGHLEGDRALTDTADILKTTFRESDIIARLGGDEFAVLALVPLDVNSELFPLRLQSQLDAHNAMGHRPYKLSMSVGVVRYDPKAPISIADLLAAADAAMYEQKRHKYENSTSRVRMSRKPEG